MEPDIRKEPNFATEVLELIRSGLPKQQLLDRLSDYHENDIAGAAEQLTAEERKALYHLLGAEQAAEVFSYLEQPARFLQELEPECSARPRSVAPSRNTPTMSAVAEVSPCAA